MRLATSFKVKRSKVRVTRLINADTIIVWHIFRITRLTNFKVGTQMEDDDPHQAQAPRHPRSKVKVARSRDQCEPSWPKCCTCVIRGRRGHTVSAEPGGHTSCLITFTLHVCVLLLYCILCACIQQSRPTYLQQFSLCR